MYNNVLYIIGPNIFIKFYTNEHRFSGLIFFWKKKRENYTWLIFSKRWIFKDEFVKSWKKVKPQIFRNLSRMTSLHFWDFHYIEASESALFFSSSFTIKIPFLVAAPLAPPSFSIPSSIRSLWFPALISYILPLLHPIFSNSNLHCWWAVINFLLGDWLFNRSIAHVIELISAQNNFCCCCFLSSARCVAIANNLE